MLSGLNHKRNMNGTAVAQTEMCAFRNRQQFSWRSRSCLPHLWPHMALLVFFFAPFCIPFLQLFITPGCLEIVPSQCPNSQRTRSIETWSVTMPYGAKTSTGDTKSEALRSMMQQGPLDPRQRLLDDVKIHAC